MSRPRTDFFRFGPVRQEAGAKHLRKGDLLEAINVRQTAKAGVYAKRLPFSRTPQTFMGGSLSGTPETVLPGTGGIDLMRDTGDQLWTRAASSNTPNTWNLMGTHPRPWPEVNTVQSNLYTTPQPFSCLVGSSLWVFALTTNAYEFSIVDAITGMITTPKITVTATGIVHASAAYNGTYVWILWVDNGANGTVRCHRITATSPAGAPVATNYYTFPSSPTDVSTVALQQVQARYFSVSNQVVVVACGGSLVSTTYKRAAMHSVLDPATGLAKSTGGLAAKVSYAVSSATAPYTIGGLYILDGQNGSGTYWYYVFVNWDTATTSQYLMIKVTATTLSTFSTVTLGSWSGATYTAAYNSSGFVDNATDSQYVLVTARSNTDFIMWSACPIWTSFFQVNSGSVTTQTAPQSAGIPLSWVASGFANVGGKWYFTTGYDDWTNFASVIGDENLSVQRGFHLRQFVPGATASLSTMFICAQFQMGNGPALWHRSTGVVAWAAGTPPVSCTTPMWATGNYLAASIGVAAAAFGYVDLALASINTAKTYGKCCQAMGYGFAPGSIPVAWSGNAKAHEVAPLLAPDFIATSGGTGSDFSIAAVVFAIYDGNGVVWRSAPKILSATFGHGASVVVPSPNCKLANTQIFVEFYIGNNGTPKLQVVQPMMDLYTIFPLTPTVANMVNGEVLYTTGNALSQTWPVACQAMGTWGNRLFFAQKNRIWTSKELESGFGPLFNEAQVSSWNEEQDEITCMAPVNFDYLAIFSANKPAVVSGQGPDGVGNGNYVIRTLSSLMGVRAGGVAIQGPQGCHYQDPGSGRLTAITPGLAVVDCGGGLWDYAAYSIDSAVWYEIESLLVFFASGSSAAFVIDYQHPQDVAPFGQTYLWTFAAGLVPRAVCLDASGMCLLSSSGDIYRPGTTGYGWADANDSGGSDLYTWRLATAELQLGDLQGEIAISKVQALLTMRSAVSLSISVYPGYASATLSDARVTTKAIALPAPANVGDSESVMTRPSNCARIQSFRVVIQEAAGQEGQGAEFEGLAVEYTMTGKALHPNAGRVI